MLWHVGDSEVYLLASIHVMDAAPFALSPQAEQAYLRSKRIAFETDLDAKPDPSILRLSAGDRLSKRVPLGLFATLSRKWAEIGAPQDLEFTQPWFAGFCIQLTLAARRGITAERGVDKYLWNRAAGDRKPIMLLEAYNAALQAYASAPPEEQVRFLSHVAENTDVNQGEIDAMVRAWRAGLKEPFEEFLQRLDQRAPQLCRMLVADRNKAWMPRLSAFASDGVPTLVVVGALHFVGAVGLPALLAQSGRAVSRADGP